MHKKLFQTGIALLLALCLLAVSACAETVRGDLSERFGDIPRIEYEGQSYALKNRITTVLAMGIGKGEDDQALSDVNFMLVIDDNAKTFTVMEIPPDTLVEFPMDDGTHSNMRFQDVFALGADLDDGGVKMVRAMNTLLGEDLVEHYLAFDAQGADLSALAGQKYQIPRVALPAHLYMQSSGMILGVAVLFGGSLAPQIMSRLIESGWEIEYVLGLCAGLFALCALLSLLVNVGHRPQQTTE